MAKKQPTKQTESATTARPKTQNKTEAAAPPKVVSAIGQGKFQVREATMKVHEVGPIEPHKYRIEKPTSSNAESHNGDPRQISVLIKDIADAYIRSTHVAGSKHGAVVHSSVSGKVETPQSGQGIPTSN